MLLSALSHFSRLSAILKKVMINQFAEKKDICLIGGGHSHIIAIKQLGMQPPSSNIRISLICNDQFILYSGMLPGLISGHYLPQDCYIDLQKLCNQAKITFIQDEVERIDLLSKQIYCNLHTRFSYDLMSINIGSQPMLLDIKGASRYGCPIKPLKQFLPNWLKWLHAAQSTNEPKHIVIIGGGAASIEILLAIHYKLSHTNLPHVNFSLICAHPSILNSYNQRIKQYFDDYLNKLGINVITGKRVTAINQHKLVIDNDMTLDYDFVVWATNASAQPWVAKSGLKCDPSGFILVDQFLRSVSHTDVFAVGDCANFIHTPLVKNGVYAVRQGPILANNLIAASHNRSLLAFKPQKYFLSLLATGDRHAVASLGPLHAHGKWIWLWKNYIDRTFIEQFNQ
ncbi:MAG: hypothetical protein DYH15_02040 [Nitrosomonas sp. PRO4]|nr:hypothetical protein [Nitrosomonas sp. PRO4]